MKTIIKHCAIGLGVMVAGGAAVIGIVRIIDRLAYNPVIICVPLIFLFLFLGALCME